MAVAEISRQKKTSRKDRVRRRTTKKAKSRQALSPKVWPKASPYRDALFLQVIKEAGYQAAQRGMASMGFIVAAENDFLIKQYPDGRTEKISSIEKVPLPEIITLD